MNENCYRNNTHNTINNTPYFLQNIYLDTSATTQPRKEVIAEITKYMTNKWYNPSSLYSPSKEVKNNIEEVRCKVAKSINAEPNEIFFTSGGSESNSMAILGLLNSNKVEIQKVITSGLEHSSIVKLLESKTNQVSVDIVKCHTNGKIDLSDLITKLESIKSNGLNRKTLVTIQFANNEIGTIQDIKTISDLVHMTDKNFILHTDAVQAYGHIPIDVKELDVDMLSVSGHKIGCPKGIGFLYIKENIQHFIEPIIYGTQEQGLRGGTENVPYIMGLGKAIEYLNYDNSELISKRKYFENGLIKLGFEINGSDNKLPNNISATYAPPFDFNNESLIYILDMFGIYISSGSACNSTQIKPSLVLKNIGLTDNLIAKTIRITMPPDITKEQINYVLTKIEESIMILQLDNKNKLTN